MRCWDARAAIWPPERPRLLVADVRRARAHVSRCPECVLYLARDRAVLDTCRELGSMKAPLEVRARVYQAVACAERGQVAELEGRRRRGSDRSSEPDRRGRLKGGAIVSAVGVLGLLAVLITTLGEGPRVSGRETPPREQAYVEDYLRRAVGQDFLDSSDPDVIARFLHRELGLRSPLLRISGLVPTRVEICLLEGRRGAMVVYELDGRSVSHYLVPKTGRPHPPRVAEDQGSFAVVTWSSGAVEEALVSEVPSEELLSLARVNGAG